MEKLKELVRAYRESLECDYCYSGIYKGLRPDEIALRICNEIEIIVKKVDK